MIYMEIIHFACPFRNFIQKSRILPGRWRRTLTRADAPRRAQPSMAWHMDDIISSHVDPKVNNNFHKWLTKTYAEDGVGEVKLQRGKKHGIECVAYTKTINCNSLRCGFQVGWPCIK